MVVVEEDSVVVGEAAEVRAGDHSKEAGVDLRNLATTIAITEERKRVKMYMMKKSVKTNPVQSYFMCIPLFSGAAALSTCYPCVPNAAAAVLRKRKLHKLNKEPMQEPMQEPRQEPKQHPKKEPKKELKNKYEIPSMS